MLVQSPYWCVRRSGACREFFLKTRTALLDLLTTERESAVVEATRLRNQIHAHPMQITPSMA